MGQEVNLVCGWTLAEARSVCVFKYQPVCVCVCACSGRSRKYQRFLLPESPSDQSGRVWVLLLTLLFKSLLHCS